MWIGWASGPRVPPICSSDQVLFVGNELDGEGVVQDFEACAIADRSWKRQARPSSRCAGSEMKEYRCMRTKRVVEPHRQVDHIEGFGRALTHVGHAVFSLDGPVAALVNLAILSQAKLDTCARHRRAVFDHAQVDVALAVDGGRD